MTGPGGESSPGILVSPQPIPTAQQEAPHSTSYTESTLSTAAPTTITTTSDGLASQQQPSQTQSTPSQNDPLPQPPCFANSFSSSPRLLPSDLPDAILEEGAESGSDSPLEPVTPTSRHSQDFTTLQSSSVDENYLPQYDYSRSNPAPFSTPKAPVLTSQSPTPPQPSKDSVSRPSPKPIQSATPDQGSPLTRRSTRSSTGSSFKRTMSNLFRRSTSQATPPPAQQPNGVANGAANPPSQQSQTSSSTSTLRASTSNNQDPAKRSTGPTANGGPPSSWNTRRFSINRSANTTRSNTPPSPGSPVERSTFDGPTSTPNGGGLPGANEFDAKRKNRSSTGLSLRGKTINFLTPATRGGRQPRAQRASSFDSERAQSKSRPPKSAHGEDQTYPPERLPWPLPPDAGTGAKARRMSVSLPDDFNVDVAELSHEFEYQHKLLGRHGKHLGKGAASKVTLMVRKGCPEELYAVKEFRGKSHRESREDYDKKIKSEFSIAKSLHHPNIVETIRLCTDHSRWNHVMEYCSEGDLFSLVSKGWLKDENRKKDRLCLFKQLVQGVNYLHQNGIAHRDIKLENLLITKDSKLKITDFGVSEVFSGTHPGLREAGGQCGRNMGDLRLCSPGICGSEPYIAPEVLAKKEDYDPRPLDVWSTAIVMVYLTFGGAIWTRAAPGNEHYDALVRGWDKWNAKHPSPDACISDTDYPHHKAFDLIVTPPALRRILLQMLNPDPSKRISINDVINNRWMKGVECCQMESYDDPSQVIDATKRDSTWNGPKKIFCHSHLPPKSQGHSLGKMPGQPGY